MKKKEQKKISTYEVMYWLVYAMLSYFLGLILILSSSLQQGTVYQNFAYSGRLTVQDIFHLKQGQSMMTEMLRQLDSICTQHNIAYFIFAGNLIGQRLYGGWIPWDADVDVYVAQSDYDRLKEILIRSPPSKTWYQTLETDSSYYRHIGALPIGKLRHLESCYLKCQDGEKWHNGLQIDINTYEIVDGKIVFGTRNKGEKRIEQSIELADIFPLIRVPYDGITVSAPRDIDKMLDLHYGEKWRQLPPISKRFPHEGKIDPHSTCEHHKLQYPQLYS